MTHPRNLLMHHVFFVCINLLIFFFLSQTVSAQEAADTLVLNEPFDNNNFHWPEENHDSAFSKVENGNYVFNNKMSSRVWSYRLAPAGVFTRKPNVLEMKMKSMSDAGNAIYGILWHTMLLRHGVYNEYGFLISAIGNATIIQKLNDTLIVIKPWAFIPSINQFGYNILRIEETTGDLFKFYINNNLVFEQSLINGEISTLGFYCDPHTVLAIDYIKLVVR